MKSGRYGYPFEGGKRKIVNYIRLESFREGLLFFDLLNSLFTKRLLLKGGGKRNKLNPEPSPVACNTAGNHLDSFSNRGERIVMLRPESRSCGEGERCFVSVGQVKCANGVD